MKLKTKIISGFLLVAILPIVLMSLLLYVYLNSRYQDTYLKQSQMVVRSFGFYLDNQLELLEKRAHQLTNDKDFLIGLLDLPERHEELTHLLQGRIHSGQFQFALVSGKQAGESIKVCEHGLADQIERFAYRLPTVAEQGSITGLTALSAAEEPGIAAIAALPVYHRGEVVGQLVIGQMLDRLVSGYQIELFDLAGLIVVSGRRIIFARSDQALAGSLAELATVEINQGVISAHLGEREFLVRETKVGGVAGEEIAAIRFVFDSAEWSAARSQLLHIFLLLVACAGGFALLVGYLYSRHLARPVTEMSAAARRIAAGEIPKRITYFYDDEIGDLVSGINRLTDDLKETERKLKTTEQVAAWQLFARQTAHELNNFLMPLATSAGQLRRLAREGAVDSDRLDGVVEDIQAEIGRMKRLLGGFSEFAKLPPPRFKRTEVARILKSIGDLFAEQIKSGALHFAAADSLPSLNCDPDQIRQVMLNLITNSYQARATVVGIQVEARDEKLWFSVLDDGDGVAVGVDPFAPLYSSKPEGSGLGLAIVRRIIVDHGGDIAYFRNPTGGTVFKFFLPTREQ
ncbi:MAG: HAMP domain-containing histidine kinase [candidate division Zixibacteria bacterium]|nr:HAMP domain-containing histidine kinase [candidate division Zixibacteria bacterium]